MAIGDIHAVRGESWCNRVWCRSTILERKEFFGDRNVRTGRALRVRLPLLSKREITNHAAIARSKTISLLSVRFAKQ